MHMKLLQLLIQSIRALLSNPVRSFLTALGIIIGIGSVIALIALGNGVRVNIEGQIQSLGPDIITVLPGTSFNHSLSLQESNQGAFQNRQGGFGTTSTLTEKDYTNIANKQSHPHVAYASGSIDGTGLLGNQRFAVLGVSESYFRIRNLSVQNGSALDSSMVAKKDKVLVLGHDLAETLFPNQNPVGKNIKIQNDTYQIIGVLDTGTENAFDNPNRTAFIPYTTAMETFGTTVFNRILAKSTNNNAVDQAKNEIQSSLLSNHGVKDINQADFSVATSADILNTFGNITRLLTSFLSGIAAISLLVGGIGIMNIMLVSVTERTREIGLRKAVGARMVDIASQFIIETMILTLIGGVFGVGAGFLMAKIAGNYIGFVPVSTTSSILLAVGMSTLIGLLFGIYPAIRAARMNPIEALRYE